MNTKHLDQPKHIRELCYLKAELRNKKSSCTAYMRIGIREREEGEKEKKRFTVPSIIAESVR